MRRELFLLAAIPVTITTIVFLWFALPYMQLVIQLVGLTILVVGGAAGYHLWEDKRLDREKKKAEVRSLTRQDREFEQRVRAAMMVIAQGGSMQYGDFQASVLYPTRTLPETRIVEAEQQKAAIPLLPSPLPGPTLMLDVMRKWDLRLDNLFLGLGRGGQEYACALDGWMHVAHDAPTGQGKTAQFYAELVMLLKLGVRVILANPHFAPVGKKGDDWRPIARAIELQGEVAVAPGVSLPGLLRKIENIASVLKWLAVQELDRRFCMMFQGDFSYEPFYLFIDEWPLVVRRHPEASEHLAEVLQRGRAVEVCVDTNSQGFLQTDVDLKGSARENFNTAYHMGGSPHSGAKLLDMSVREMNSIAREVTLGKGVALLRNNASVPQAQLVRLPYADNDYAYYMLGKADGWTLPEFRHGNSAGMRWNEPTERVPTTSAELPIIDADTTLDASYNNVRNFPGMQGDEPVESSERDGNALRLEEHEIPALIAAYKATRSRSKALAAIGHGARYDAHAREILLQAGLMKTAEREA